MAGKVGSGMTGPFRSAIRPLVCGLVLLSLVAVARERIRPGAPGPEDAIAAAPAGQIAGVRVDAVAATPPRPAPVSLAPAQNASLRRTNPPVGAVELGAPRFENSSDWTTRRAWMAAPLDATPDGPLAGDRLSESARGSDTSASPAPSTTVLSDADRLRLVSRVYRPNSISVAELAPLLRMILTPGVGTLTAARSGRSADDETLQPEREPDLLVVRDWPEVLRRVDAVFYEVDAAPRRIVIDAVIVSTAGNVDLKSLARGREAGAAAGRSPWELCDGSPWNVIEQLRAAAAVRVLGSNQLHVRNRQWGQLELAQRDGGRPGVRTKVRFRPRILADGNVRLELHPESTRPRGEGGSAAVETIAFTSDIVLHEGLTALVPTLGSESSESPLAAAESQRIVLLVALRIAGDP
jgi:hypothetical protein